jgi:hypothetical protein
MKSMLCAERAPSGKTTMRRALVVATALVFGAPATVVFAHDPGEYQGFFNHLYDHLEHQQFHQQFNDEHNAAHWQGFANPQQHQDWHRAYGATHEQFHEDHPATWHDHNGNGYYGYRPYIGYQPYGYGGWYRGY